MKKQIKFEIKPILYFLCGMILGIALVFPYNKSTAKVDSKLIKLSYSEYNERVNLNEVSVIMIGRDSCGWCKEFIPILNKIIIDKNLKIYYLDTDSLTKEEKDSLNKSDSLFTSEEFGTPTLILVQNGKIVNYNIGYMEKDEANKWLEEVGIINE